MEKKLFWLSDSITTTTGYSTISLNVLNGLVDKGWKVDMLAHNYIGQKLPPGLTLADGTKANFTIHGAGKNQYGADLIVPKNQELKPNAFGILLDTFMMYPWLLTLNFAPAQSFFYFPSDGGCGMPLGCENILRKVNMPIAMSLFAQKQVKDYYNINVEYIPHAVDTNIFYPLSDEEKFKLKMKYGLYEKFVVGSVFRNQGRKMSDRIIKTLYAFKQFAKDRNDVILFLHTDAEDSAAVFNIQQLIQRYNLENRVLFTGMKFYNSFTYKQLNEIYNLMDVFLLTTSGEGFGIPIIEAMACGVPPIVTDYTTTPELLKLNGICGRPIKLVNCEDIDMYNLMFEKNLNMKEIDNLQIRGTITGNWNVERAICDINDAAKGIEEYYLNKDLIKEHSKVGIEKVKKYYSWDIVIPQWDELLTKLIK
jgi:glycosyltransferase involved in cell wall biosynthesis